MSLFRLLTLDGDRAREIDWSCDLESSHRNLSSLTTRELEILALIGSGANNDEIARLSHISKRTVETHIHHIYSKLGLESRSRAMLYAIKRGLVNPTKFPNERTTN